MNRLQRRQAEQAAKRKPKPGKLLRQPHAQNRLLMLNDPQRLPASGILDSRIKLYLYLETLKQAHNPDDVRYFRHLVDNIRTMCLVQERPQYRDLAERAGQELNASAEDRHRRFRWLTALVNQYSREMDTTSGTLLVECNDHAAACGLLACIGNIIAQPEYTAEALKRLLNGDTVKQVAAEAGVSQTTLKKHCLDLLYQLHCIMWSEIDFPAAANLTEARTHKTEYLDMLDRLKSIARHASAQVAKFQRTFGVALINLQDLVQVA